MHCVHHLHKVSAPVYPLQTDKDMTLIAEFAWVRRVRLGKQS